MIYTCGNIYIDDVIGQNKIISKRGSEGVRKGVGGRRGDDGGRR